MVLKVIFFHNAPMPYRLPLFIELSKYYHINYLFTNLRIAQKRYGAQFENTSTAIQSIQYKLFDNNMGMRLFLHSLIDNYDVLVDSLEAPSITTFVPGRLRQKRTVYWSEELGWGRKNIKQQISSIIKRYVAKNCDVLIVPGTKHREYFINLGVREEKIIIAPNASDIRLRSEANTIDIRKELGLTNQRVALYVGRLIRRKGVEDLIWAFSQTNPDSVLIIVGQGEMRKQLESLANELGIGNRVIFEGFVSEDMLPRYYRSANVCVVPSRGEGMLDPWAFVVNEAMHYGVPVIATTAVGAAHDMVINGETGYMVPEGDIASLTDALNAVLDDRTLSNNMGNNAMKLEQEAFSYSRMVDAFRTAIGKGVGPID